MSFSSLIPLLQDAAGAPTGPSMLVPLITMGLVFFIMWLFIIRPQNKKQKETERMIANLKKGDKVVTIGGIHGVVSSTDEKTIVIKVDDNTKIKFSRSAISAVIVDDSNTKTEKTNKKEKEEVSEEKTSDGE